MTDDSFRAAGGVVANLGSAANQINLNTAGRIAFGVAEDTNLYRANADVLATDDSFYMRGARLRLEGAAPELQILSNSSAARLYFGLSADASLYRLGVNQLKTDGQFFAGGPIAAYDGDAARYVQIGSGTVPTILFATDTNLYRSAPNTLQTDDTFVAASLDVTSLAVFRSPATNAISLTDENAGMKVGSLHVDVGVERQRTIRGSVNANGTIAAGSGFTVNRSAVGTYVVTFITAFPSPPSVVNSPETALAHYLTPIPTASAFTLQCRDSAGLVDSFFTFIAIGPR